MKKAEEFVKQVEELALSMGVDFFVVSQDGAMSTNNLNNDVDVKHALSEYNVFHKKFAPITFKELIMYFDTIEKGKFDIPFDANIIIVKKFIGDGEEGNHVVGIYDIGDICDDDDWKRIMQVSYNDNNTIITVSSRYAGSKTFDSSVPLSTYDWAATGRENLRGFFMDVIGSMNNK